MEKGLCRYLMRQCGSSLWPLWCSSPWPQNCGVFSSEKESRQTGGSTSQMVALFRGGLVIARLVPVLCLLLSLWSCPEVRLVGSLWSRTSKGKLAFPGEEAGERPYSAHLATSPEFSDYIKVVQLREWDSQFAHSFQAAVGHSCTGPQPFLLCENLFSLTYSGDGDESGSPFLLLSEGPSVACAPRSQLRRLWPWTPLDSEEYCSGWANPDPATASLEAQGSSGSQVLGAWVSHIVNEVQKPGILKQQIQG